MRFLRLFTSGLPEVTNVTWPGAAGVEPVAPHRITTFAYWRLRVAARAELPLSFTFDARSTLSYRCLPCVN